MFTSMITAQLLPDNLQLDSSGELGGEGFLEALQSNLPPEAQGLSVQELLDWLREQSKAAVAQHALQPMPDPSEPLASALVLRTGEAAAGPGESDPGAVLGFIVSSREQLAAQPLEEGVAALAQEQLSQESSAAEEPTPFQTLLTPASEAADAELKLEAEKPLPVPVRHPEFGQAVGERLVWVVRNEVQAATIRLDPPSLGPLEISVSIKDDQAAIVIQAQHALTREVLEAEAPRLRGMLGEAGFAQVDVDVARDEAGQNEGRHSGQNGSRGMAAADEAGDAGTATPAARVSVGLIDQYV